MTSTSEHFRVCFRGVRGSHPVASENTLGYGGNTTCNEVMCNGRRIIFDAGTGIIRLGEDLLKEHLTSQQPIIATLLFTHTHHDHVQGLPFFTPVYLRSTDLSLFGPRTSWGSLTTVLETFLSAPFHPVAMADPDMRMTRTIHDLEGGETLIFRRGERHPRILENEQDTQSDDVIIRVCANRSHPKLGVYHYRVEFGGRAYVFATDIEMTNGADDNLVEFARGADLLAHDAQYTEDEYETGPPSHCGWGHSTIPMACETAKKAGVKRLALIHHDPDHDDDTIAAMEAHAQSLFPDSFAAHEGMVIDL